MIMLFWAMAAAGAAPSLTATQTAYMDCLSHESDAAIIQRVPVDRFAAVAAQLCEAETKAYRTASKASGTPEQFAETDTANREALVATYRNRMRARRSRSIAPPQPMPAEAGPMMVNSTQ